MNQEAVNRGTLAQDSKHGSETVASINVCHILGSLGYGGRESLLEDLISKSPDGISYTVCGLRAREGHTDRFERLGADVVSFDAKSKRDVRALWRMFRFLYRHPIDILHAHGPNAQVPSRLIAPISGIDAVVSTVHGIKQMFSDRQLQLERVTRRFETKTIAVSDGVKQSYVGNQASSQWETIYNGIDVTDFHQKVNNADGKELEKRHGLEGSETTLLNIGRYVPPKSQLDLIEAVDHIIRKESDIHLFIVGGRGAMEDRLREKVTEYDLEDVITVTGPVKEIHSYYALADMFVSSSVSEGLPIVQLEAMAAGLPVVATDIPGVRELVVDGKTGRLVTTNSPELLADVVLKIIREGDIERFGQAGLVRVKENFCIEQTVSEYIQLYERVAPTRGNH